MSEASLSNWLAPKLSVILDTLAWSYSTAEAPADPSLFTIFLMSLPWFAFESLKKDNTKYRFTQS